MSTNNSLTEQTITREQFADGALAWDGATVGCRPYQFIRELPDGRFIFRGPLSQEPKCELERAIVKMMRPAVARHMSVLHRLEGGTLRSRPPSRRPPVGHCPD